MKIMGILNVTPDSFSDGGQYTSVEAALAQAQQLLQAGADIIDIGGETTRPGAQPVSAEEECARVLPVIRAIAKLGCEISIDTYKASVAKAAIEAGATMINDVSGAQYDVAMAQVAAQTGVPLILMHNEFAVGETPHAKRTVTPSGDIGTKVRTQLQAMVAHCEAAGVQRTQLILDPGIGFAKTAAESVTLLAHLEQLQQLGYPLLLGASRKRFLTPYVSEETLHQRDVATAITSVRALEAGCAYVRVHDVATTKTALQMWQACQRTDETTVKE